MRSMKTGSLVSRCGLLGFSALAMALAAGIRIQAGDPPQRGDSVALVLDEKVGGVFEISGKWVDPGAVETVIHSILLDEGFEVLEPSTVRSLLLRDQAVQALGGDKKAVMSMGASLGSDWIISGTGHAKPSGNVLGTGMKSLRANVELKLLEAKSGSIWAVARANTAQVHTDEVAGGAEALGKAAEQAIQTLLENASSKPASTVESEVVKVTISGLVSYRHYMHVQEWIEENANGFKAFKDASYTAGTAHVELDASETGHSLAKRMALAEFEGFVMNPIDVQDDHIQLKVILKNTE